MLENSLEFTLFYEAVKNGDDPAAITMLNDRLVSESDVIVLTSCHLFPTLHLVIYYERGLLVRAMADRGFDLDAFTRVSLKKSDNIMEASALGIAIGHEKTEMIGLCIFFF